MLWLVGTNSETICVSNWLPAFIGWFKCMGFVGISKNLIECRKAKYVQREALKLQKQKYRIYELRMLDSLEIGFFSYYFIGMFCNSLCVPNFPCWCLTYNLQVSSKANRGHKKKKLKTVNKTFSTKEFTVFVGSNFFTNYYQANKQG